MRSLRPLFLAIVLACAFYYLTTHSSGWRAPSWVSRPAQVEITQAAGPPTYDTEEQANISVYKKALPSVVNITSTAVAFDFFYGAVPQQGQGSGFVIDSEGHILTNYHVVEGARRVEVNTSDKKKYRAEIIGADLAAIMASMCGRRPSTFSGGTRTVPAMIRLMAQACSSHGCARAWRIS